MAVLCWGISVREKVKFYDRFYLYKKGKTDTIKEKHSNGRVKKVLAKYILRES